jgi:hypothetical protein
MSSWHHNFTPDKAPGNLLHQKRTLRLLSEAHAQWRWVTVTVTDYLFWQHITLIGATVTGHRVVVVTPEKVTVR